MQNAQPLRIDDDVLVFGVDPQMLGAASERFRSQADIVRDALAERVGRRFRFTLEAAPEFAVDGPDANAAAEPDDSPLVEAREEHPPEADPPPVSRLRTELGATVVEEVPRAD